ncbi:helix-turn-helix transcriptional regulator [Nocardia aurantia]|uniref:HTH cro/C1-type domain-containing protein n=1 Tax=Nocardia aurantia TaxID=2585199 RepID=A0A7K0DIP0_9NOCA|nr:helix-turn-helix transcriptional regulator [Nocardia aurantia]MQY25132.1 hypothetical protein [Nocardia aurantia]
MTRREQVQALDLAGERNFRNAINLTKARRRLLRDLIGIRKRREISQAQVADAIGIDRSGISRFESDIEGSNPTIDVILRYAHAVGASIHMWAEPLEVAEARHVALIWQASADSSSPSRPDFHRPRPVDAANARAEWRHVGAGR